MPMAERVDPSTHWVEKNDEPGRGEHHRLNGKSPAVRSREPYHPTYIVTREPPGVAAVVG